MAVGRGDVERWLERYGRAWEEGDPEAAAALFTPDAHYWEAPFDEPMVGREAIRACWEEGAAGGQEEVRFAFRCWGVSGSQGFAGWRARFRRVGSGERVELDGAFRLVFEEAGDGLRCRSLEEWWHRRAAPPRLPPGPGGVDPARARP